MAAEAKMIRVATIVIPSMMLANTFCNTSSHTEGKKKISDVQLQGHTSRFQHHQHPRCLRKHKKVVYVQWWWLLVTSGWRCRCSMTDQHPSRHQSRSAADIPQIISGFNAPLLCLWPNYYRQFSFMVTWHINPGGHEHTLHLSTIACSTCCCKLYLLGRRLQVGSTETILLHLYLPGSCCSLCPTKGPKNAGTSTWKTSYPV